MIRRSLFPSIDDKATPPVHDPDSLREHFQAFITDPKLTVYTRKGEDGTVSGTLYIRLNAGVFMYETDAQVYEQTRIRMNDVVRTFVNLLNSSLRPKIFVVSKTVRHEEKGCYATFGTSDPCDGDTEDMNVVCLPVSLFFVRGSGDNGSNAGRAFDAEKSNATMTPSSVRQCPLNLGFQNVKGQVWHVMVLPMQMFKI